MNHKTHHTHRFSDPREGLPQLRAPWVAKREGDANPTQMYYARQVRPGFDCV